MELDRGNQVGILVLYGIQIIRLRISGLKKVHLSICEATRGAGRVKSNRTDEQNWLKSIWMTGFKPILCQIKFVIVWFDFYTSPLTTVHCSLEESNFFKNQQRIQAHGVVATSSSIPKMCIRDHELLLPIVKKNEKPNKKVIFCSKSNKTYYEDLLTS